MKIGVALAIYETNEQHHKMAVETLDSISSEKHEIITCGWNNGPALPEEWQRPFTARGHVHENDENNVSRAWNRGIECLLRVHECQYVFVPNLDIVLQPGALDRFVEAVSKRPDAELWTMANWHYRWDIDGNPGIANAPIHDNWVPYPHFSAFMVDHRLFEEVGPFDEAFKPAYNEDIDMHWRIRLAGKEALQYEGARFYHYGSITIRADPVLNEANNATHGLNNLYFTQKWGFKPATADDAFTDGMYHYPFNDPAKVGFEKDYMKSW